MALKKIIYSAMRAARSWVPSRPAKLITPAELAESQEQFRVWREANPGRPLRDFYSESKRNELLQGRAQSTIGGNLRNGDFYDAGRSEFTSLLGCGLRQDSRCVDYGCGTLRIGQHIIRYLERGAYWGVDIDFEFLSHARRLIGDELISDKEPNLRVISEHSLLEAAQANPDFIFSYKVIQHVHPDELTDYMRGFQLLVGTESKAFIFNANWRDNDTFQYRPKGWAHDMSKIKRIADNLGLKVECVQAKEKTRPLGTAMVGNLQISRR